MTAAYDLASGFDADADGLDDLLSCAPGARAACLVLGAGWPDGE